MKKTEKTEVMLAFCNAPTDAVARQIGDALVREGAAACVNILPPCRSIYRWQGDIESESETPMLIKTVARRLPDVTAIVKRLHPFDVPEIIAVTVGGGSDDYLRWVMEQCGD